MVVRTIAAISSIIFILLGFTEGWRVKPTKRHRNRAASGAPTEPAIDRLPSDVEEHEQELPHDAEQSQLSKFAARAARAQAAESAEVRRGNDRLHAFAEHNHSSALSSSETAMRGNDSLHVFTEHNDSAENAIEVAMRRVAPHQAQHDGSKPGAVSALAEGSLGAISNYVRLVESAWGADASASGALGSLVETSSVASEAKPKSKTKIQSIATQATGHSLHQNASAAVELAHGAGSGICGPNTKVNDKRVFCAVNCTCVWYQRCYPMHLLSSEGDGVIMNVGVCELGVTAMMGVSIAIFVSCLLCVFLFRLFVAVHNAGMNKLSQGVDRGRTSTAHSSVTDHTDPGTRPEPPQRRRDRA